MLDESSNFNKLRVILKLLRWTIKKKKKEIIIKNESLWLILPAWVTNLFTPNINWSVSIPSCWRHLYCLTFLYFCCRQLETDANRPRDKSPRTWGWCARTRAQICRVLFMKKTIGDNCVNTSTIISSDLKLKGHGSQNHFVWCFGATK